MRKQYSTVSFKGQVVFVGIDVHKKQWTVTIRHCRQAQKTFTMDPEPEKLGEYLKRNYPDAEYRSVYEAGFSGFEAHRALCRLGVQNIVINPSDVPTSGKERENKNDGCDSRKLARELENGSLEPIYIPEPENLILRNLKRREDQIVQNLARVKNRIKSHLLFAGIKFISWAGGSLKTLEENARKRNDYALLSMLRELRFLRTERLQVIRDERACLKLLNREKIQENIQSVSGIGFRTSVALQAELWDMGRFKTSDHLNSYVGLAPHAFGSGEDVTVRCGNRKKKQLHYLMIEAAWRAVRYNLEYKARYGALLGRGMSSQKAIVVIAKKLMQAIRAVWLQDRKYINFLQAANVK